MEKLKTIAKESNISTQLFTKGEILLMSVFGLSMESFLDLFNDSFQKRRFKNLINILTLTQEQLETQKITPQKVELALLIPLIKYAALEEDKLLQKKWAKLIVYIVSTKDKVLFKKNAIRILSKIGREEAEFFDELYNKDFMRKLERLTPFIRKTEFGYDRVDFDINFLKSKEKIKTYNEIKLLISNLITMGIIEWLTEFGLSSFDFDIDQLGFVNYRNTNDNFGGSFYYHDYFQLTPIGFQFARICSAEEQ